MGHCRCVLPSNAGTVVRWHTTLVLLQWSFWEWDDIPTMEAPRGPNGREIGMLPLPPSILGNFTHMFLIHGLMFICRNVIDRRILIYF